MLLAPVTTIVDDLCDAFANALTPFSMDSVVCLISTTRFPADKPATSAAVAVAVAAPIKNGIGILTTSYNLNGIEASLIIASNSSKLWYSMSFP